jgi:hypothetical protein
LSNTGGPLVDIHALKILPLAFIYCVPTVASLALKAFDNLLVCMVTHCDYMCDLDLELRAPMFELDEFSLHLAGRIPTAILLFLYRHQTRYLDNFVSHEAWWPVAKAMTEVNSPVAIREAESQATRRVP